LICAFKIKGEETMQETKSTFFQTTISNPRPSNYFQIWPSLNNKRANEMDHSICKGPDVQGVLEGTNKVFRPFFEGCLTKHSWNQPALTFLQNMINVQQKSQNQTKYSQYMEGVGIFG
jgi:hypothetical protein